MKLRIPSYLTDRFVPDLEAINLLEYFLISAVSALLGIRAYLSLTGFPQLGGEDLHIAHMLWGGLLMLIAIIAFMSFINSHGKVVASVIGGMGFGTFIDELGKFITTDNNYFYKPTIAIIYIIFILIFLIMKWLSSISQYSPKTYLANAVEGLRELVIFDLDSNEKEKALRYLRKSDQEDDVVKALNKIMSLEEVEKANTSLYVRVKKKMFKWYTNALNVKFVSKGLVLFFVVASTAGLVSSITYIVISGDLSFARVGLLASSIVVVAMVFGGVRDHMKGNLVNSYMNLQRASLFAIFISQFFLFLLNEFDAIISLIGYISVYLVLKFAIEAEDKR